MNYGQFIIQMLIEIATLPQKRKKDCIVGWHRIMSGHQGAKFAP